MSISKIFIPNFCVCSTNKRYKTYQTGFSFCHLGHTPWVGLWGAGNAQGGSKNCFFFQTWSCGISNWQGWRAEQNASKIFILGSNWWPWAEVNWSNIIKFWLPCQFQFFIPKLLVFSQIKDRKHIEQNFHSVGGGGGGGGVKNFMVGICDGAPAFSYGTVPHTATECITTLSLWSAVCLMSIFVLSLVCPLFWISRSYCLFFQDPRSCVQLMCRECMLHESGTWPLTRPDLQRLPCNDRAMIRQTCDVKSENVATVRLNKLLARLEIDGLNIILEEKRLCWFGHVERSSGTLKTVCEMQIEEKCGPGWPKMTLTERDCHEWNINEVDPCDRDVWRSSVRSAMRAASQLPGKEPTDVDDVPASAC